jgi:hypothetical protein
MDAKDKSHGVWIRLDEQTVADVLAGNRHTLTEVQQSDVCTKIREARSYSITYRAQRETAEEDYIGAYITELAIDPDAAFSPVDTMGVWVMGWFWVPFDE